MDVTAQALNILYLTDSLNKALIKVARLRGGDSDSVGPVLGMLAGAMYGISNLMSNLYLKGISKYDGFQVAMRAYMLYKYGGAGEETQTGDNDESTSMMRNDRRSSGKFLR